MGADPIAQALGPRGLGVGVIARPLRNDRITLESVIGFSRNRRSLSIGTGDRFGLESLIAFPRNTQLLHTGNPSWVEGL